MSERRSRAELAADVESLKFRLAEAEETLEAIRQGDVDALVVGEKIFVLEGVEAASNRFRGDVIEQIDDAVIAVDNEQRITYLNAAAQRLYGSAAIEALGQPDSTIFERVWLEADEELRAGQVLLQAGSWRGRNVHVKRSGERIHVESSVTVTHDAHGSKTGLLTVVRNVTARVNAERELAAQRAAAETVLREADRRKDEFLATLAHELRNPLAPIRNALHILQQADDEATRDQSQRIIARQLQQMVHLVDDLLDVSRISQGKVELRLRRVDVVVAVQAAIETSRPLIDAGQQHLSVNLPPPQTLFVNADLTRLCQVISNILNNAAKYTPASGRIDISAEQDGPDVLIRVRDSGIGIAEGMLSTIFEMFAQVDRSHERTQGGLGIGLALVKQLVEMHGGRVQARSEGVGCGSEFGLRFPLAAGEPAEVQARDPRGASLPASAQQRVLVVDDNVDSAQTLAEVLSLMGYDTQTAGDGLEACALTETWHPSAVLLDLGMPRMGGLDAARRIRAQVGGRDIMLVALSGWGQETDRRKSAEAGFDHHCVKPVEIDSLTALLSRMQHPRPQV